MKLTLIANFGIVALYTMFASPAQGGCGRINSGTAALSVMKPAHRALQLETGTEAEQTAAVAGPQSIVGLWLTTATLGGGEFQAFEAFTGDGIEILNDNGSPLAGNVCLGVWASGPAGNITVNHPSWSYDESGNLIGTVVIKTQITLDPGGNSFRGTITVDAYDLNGVLQFELSGTVTSTRIRA